MKYKVSSCIMLIELRTLVAGILPVVLGSLYSKYAYNSFDIFYFGLLLVAIILIQSATNMINDYFDYKRNIDNGKEDKVLVSGDMTPKEIILLIYSFNIIAGVIGVYLAIQTNLAILLVGVMGVCISLFYSFGPKPISHTPLGEVISGGTMGTGIIATVIYIHSGVVDFTTIIVSLPTAIFIANIMLSNNISDIDPDKKSGRKTLTTLLGVKKSEEVWVVSTFMLVIITVVLALGGIYPIRVLGCVLLMFPYYSIKGYKTIEKNVTNKAKTMKINAKVGLCYHLGVFLGLLLAIIL